MTRLSSLVRRSPIRTPYLISSSPAGTPPPITCVDPSTSVRARLVQVSRRHGTLSGCHRGPILVRPPTDATCCRYCCQIQQQMARWTGDGREVPRLRAVFPAPRALEGSFWRWRCFSLLISRRIFIRRWRRPETNTDFTLSFAPLGVSCLTEKLFGSSVSVRISSMQSRRLEASSPERTADEGDEEGSSGHSARVGSPA